MARLWRAFSFSTKRFQPLPKNTFVSKQLDAFRWKEDEFALACGVGDPNKPEYGKRTVQNWLNESLAGPRTRRR
jgi:hypothetical protein